MLLGRTACLFGKCRCRAGAAADRGLPCAGRPRPALHDSDNADADLTRSLLYVGSTSARQQITDDLEAHRHDLTICGMVVLSVRGRG